MPRPKSFQTEEVLDRAIGVFWDKGYDAASVDDLTKAMGINRFSMYNEFGDKHGLFVSAMRKYHEEWRETSLAQMHASEGGLDEIASMLNAAVDAALSHATERCGCVMVLTAVTQAPHDPEVASLVSEHHKAYVGALESMLSKAKERSELPERASTLDAARFLSAVAQGLIVAAAGGQSRTALRRTVRHAIDSLRA